MDGIRAFAVRALAVMVAACLLGSSALAQEESEVDRQMRELPWKMSPEIGNIAGKANVPLTGMRFLEPAPTDKFMELTGNLPRENAYLLGREDLGWFGVLDFVPDGYVKDDEKIDADRLLRILEKSEKTAAEERKKRGLPVLVLDGWQLPPQYDTENKRLEWAILLHNDRGERVVNYVTKLLGRTGYTTAVLVTDPLTFNSDVYEFKAALKSVEYVRGEKYSEWRSGDKVAAYGLGALVVGGAAAVATKKGFWSALAGVFAAFWKLILGVGVAMLAGLGSLFKKKNQ